MAMDIAFGADADRRRKDSEALEPAQPVDDCFAHGEPTVNTTSTTTISSENVSAMSGAMIDRGNVNMAAPFTHENTRYSLRIPEPAQSLDRAAATGSTGAGVLRPGARAAHIDRAIVRDRRKCYFAALE
jgi:hypothetical protein